MTGKLKDVPGSLGTGDGGGTGGGTGGGDTTGNQVIDEIITAAKNQLGKPYLLGAEGPAKYDCSGLVDYCFRTTGNYALIGSARKRAAGYAHWFADHGHYTTDLSKRGPGDLIAFAHPG
jgi:cell wall-associated NlpC family hydrolase